MPEYYKLMRTAPIISLQRTKRSWAHQGFHWLAAATLCTGAALPAGAQQLNVTCSVQAEWCTLAATEFERQTGIKVAIALKGSGEAFAQIAAEKANPKIDLWFGGTGDPHLQAAELGLTEEHKSPLLAQLQPWAQKTVGTVQVSHRRQSISASSASVTTPSS